MRTAAPVGRPLARSTGRIHRLLSITSAIAVPSGEYTGPSSPRVLNDMYCPSPLLLPVGLKARAPVLTSTVRIWLVPSRNLRVYGLSAPMAMVLPAYDQLGLLGANRFSVVEPAGGAPTACTARVLKS